MNECKNREIKLLGILHVFGKTSEIAKISSRENIDLLSPFRQTS